ncbi:MAG TPA: nucleoside triphosphate pyrophosphohydrolase [Anaerolineae bacterium]|nr:nucleoside triphosphate pyrophosphohydrolase [Anaerolineae bacterium]
MTITIVGLGPGDGWGVTREAWQILTTAPKVYVRTARHPAVADFADETTVVSFDHLYETADSFQDVYSEIVARLLDLAVAGETVVYAVPGHPYMGETTVPLLQKQAEVAGIAVRVVAGLSFVEPMLTAVGYDGLDGLQIFDALDLLAWPVPPVQPDQPLIVAQVYNRQVAGDLKLALMRCYPEESAIVLVHGAGTAEEVIEQLQLYELDRSELLAHLSSLYIPALVEGGSLTRLAETVAILRSPDGCPWDQEQTPQSMRSGLLEEAAEVLAALDADDPDALCEELGDLLYHIVMQTEMAQEEELFTLTDVLMGIDTKLKRRHPHVWGEVEVADSDEVLRNWDEIKLEEKGMGEAKSVLDNIPEALPALARSQKIQQKASKVGFDWPDVEGVLAKFDEELAEFREATTQVERAAEMGDMLFVLVNWCRWFDLDAEVALREANRKFMRRFREVERLMVARELVWAEQTSDSLLDLWAEAKAAVARQEGE